MPFLKKEESDRYLGVPISLIYDASELNSITEKPMKDLEKIRDSLLAPWQKLDSIRTFNQPALTYALRACPVTHNSLYEYREKLVEVLRAICHLPKTASVSYFFADKNVGGLGLQDPFNKRHIQKIVHTIKILSSQDPGVQNISHGQLKSVVYRCFHRDPTEEIGMFLSGSHEGDLQNHSSNNNSQTLWSCCRISAKALNMKITGALSEPVVSCDNVSSAKAKSVASYLHHHCLLKHADQGKGKIPT